MQGRDPLRSHSLCNTTTLRACLAPPAPPPAWPLAWALWRAGGGLEGAQGLQETRPGRGERRGLRQWRGRGWRGHARGGAGGAGAEARAGKTCAHWGRCSGARSRDEQRATGEQSHRKHARPLLYSRCPPRLVTGSGRNQLSLAPPAAFMTCMWQLLACGSRLHNSHTCCARPEVLHRTALRWHGGRLCTSNDSTASFSPWSLAAPCIDSSSWSPPAPYVGCISESCPPCSASPSPGLRSRPTHRHLRRCQSLGRRSLGRRRQLYFNVFTAVD